MKIHAYSLICFILVGVLNSPSAFAEEKSVPEEKPRPEITKNLLPLMQNMGLKIGKIHGNSVEFDIKGWNYEIEYSKNGQNLFLHTWWEVPKDKYSKIPFDRMLIWNGTSPNFYGLNKYPDGNEELVLTNCFPSSDLNATSLRERIDIFQSDVDESGDITDSEKWK